MCPHILLMTSSQITLGSQPSTTLHNPPHSPHSLTTRYSTRFFFPPFTVVRMSPPRVQSSQPDNCKNSRLTARTSCKRHSGLAMASHQRSSRNKQGHKQASTLTHKPTETTTHTHRCLHVEVSTLLVGLSSLLCCFIALCSWNYCISFLQDSYSTRIVVVFIFFSKRTTFNHNARSQGRNGLQM